MTTHAINDCQIDVPDDMTAAFEAAGGGYDAILYRGREIYTFEAGRVEQGLYVGPFGVDNRDTGFVDTVDDLAAARAYIDAALDA